LIAVDLAPRRPQEKLIPVSCRPSAVHLELLSELGRMGVGEQTAFAVTGLFREFSGATHVGRH